MVCRLPIVLLAFAAAVVRGESLPTVASINLCTDQLLLSVGEPAQIRSISWLSADPIESMLADEASRFPLNYGTAEEILRVAPDVVLGGTLTSSFTRALLADLGFEVVTISPATSIADIARNVRQVAAAIGRETRAEEIVAEMHARVHRIEIARGPKTVDGIVVRPGGFTVGAGTLVDDLMRLAGLANVAAENGLDVWGSLSLESLVTSAPELLIFTGYRNNEPSLANEFLAHPLVARLAATQRATAIDAAFWSCGIPTSLESAERLLAVLQSPAK
jgi:iron complex transport system substrate-binding protein